MADQGAEVDFSSMPLGERLAHKNWKARNSGFEDLAKLYKTSAEDDPIYAKYADLLKKYAADSNAAAQEAAVAAILEFLTYAPQAVAARVAADLLKPITDKCIASTRTGTRTKAHDVYLLAVEVLEGGDEVLEALMGAYTAKQPKLVAAAVSATAAVVEGFGVKTVNVKPLLKQLPKLFAHSDKNVRAEATSLTVVLYRYIGDAINNFLNDLKPIQQKELQDEFAKAPTEKLVPSRLTRSQKAEAAVARANPVAAGDSMAGPAAGNDDEDEDAKAEAALAFIEPIDLLKKMDGAFYKNLASSKWKERKEALDGLLELAKSPKIKDDKFGELVGTLAKRINDANIVCATIVIQVLDALARGLRKDFAPYRSMITSPLLEKFKEKKTNVVEAIRSTLDAVFASTSIEAMLEDVVSVTGHKNPQVRAESLRFLTRCFQSIRSAPGKAELKTMAEALIKAMDDGDTNVRDAAAEALGTLMKVLGERPLLTYMEKLDKLKADKVKEFCEKAVVKGIKQAPAPKAAPTAAAAKGGAGGGGGPAKLPPKLAARLAARRAEASARDDDDALPGDARQKAARARDDKGPHKWVLDGTRTDLIDFLQEQASACFTAPLVTQLFSNGHYKEKDHMAGLAALDECLVAKQVDCVYHSDVIFKYVTLRFQDTNTTMLLRCLDVVEHLVALLEENDASLTDYEANAFVPSLLIKTGDSKPVIQQRIRAVLVAINLLYPPAKLWPMLLKATETKNARVRAECIDELGQMIARSGMGCCNTKSIPSIAAFISEREATVRNAALSTLIEIARAVGETQLFKLVGRLPEKDKSMLEQRVKRANLPDPMEVDEKPPAAPAAPASRAASTKPGVSGMRAPGAPSRFGAPSAAASRESLAPSASSGSLASMDDAPIRPPSQPPSRLGFSSSASANGSMQFGNGAAGGMQPPQQQGGQFGGAGGGGFGYGQQQQAQQQQQQYEYEQQQQQQYDYQQQQQAQQQQFGGYGYGAPPPMFNQPPPQQQSQYARPPAFQQQQPMSPGFGYNGNDNGMGMQPPQQQYGGYAGHNGGFGMPPPMQQQGSQSQFQQQPPSSRPTSMYGRPSSMYGTPAGGPGAGGFGYQQEAPQTPQHTQMGGGGYGYQQQQQQQAPPPQTPQQPYGAPPSGLLANRFAANAAPPQFALTPDRLSYQTLSTKYESVQSPEAVMEMIVLNVTSNDAMTALESLRQLEKIIPTQPQLLLQHSNNLLASIALQVRLAFTADDSGPVMRLCKHLLNTLLQFFDVPILAQALTQETLAQLLTELLTRLLDTALANRTGGPQLVKALNMLVVRILDKTPGNQIFGVLLGMLGEALNSMYTPEQQKYAELTMKCLWKAIRMLTTYLQDDKIDVAILLRDIHVFLETIHANEWKKRDTKLGDVPIRTIKTMLSELTTAFGESITDHFYLIENYDEAYVYTYTKNLLASQARKRAASGPGVAGAGAGAGSGLARPLSSASSGTNLAAMGNDAFLPRSTSSLSQGSSAASLGSAPGDPGTRSYTTLQEIFAKIGSRDQSKEGIYELYQFQRQNPHLQGLIDEYTKRTGSFFQNYIKRHLSVLEKEEMAAAQGGVVGGGMAPAIAPAESDRPFGSASSLPSYGAQSGMRPPSSFGAPPPSAAAATPSPSGTVASVANLRERLARMRMNIQNNSTTLAD
ncbi:hypothetical protein AMAG_00065 [Allomyces macrogynus ATCC 38327]|uniref:TOG domain-containing protein n=1 Tax=Allomyces macrogynus (strain ATCC 38327) TaxID=578462 RepID=A0A0L0RUX2_ALLM3|nr:hypothetical protein AMAG_00065 [Allomyces macrogynus ATCC 38327]|eukprot:KNE54063.1 hypothetical protein AMAG_00065 [Allomyces macrogynus ATCC 38327]